NHHITWGAGARRYDYDITNAVAPTGSFGFQPAKFATSVLNVFAQDQMSLGHDVALTLGIKGERDPSSGDSWMPNLRLSWKPAYGTLLWAAASHAIRAPTPLDTHVFETLESVPFIVGNPRFEPEKLTAYELGYREQFGSRVM